ncbi:phage protease [Xanthobacter sp. 126]|uniref:phage protease n=1 Tax=Xanthobacter sp. 126 TaxID=1131814 RepID=UPI00045E7AA9|nr:phage protease [Xanthobacter sp. 126]
MSRRSATPTTPLATGVIAGEVATLAAGDALPSEIKIAPAGTVTTRDGRSFSFDPAVLVARFQAEGVDLPIDLDHAISRRSLFGERANAVGWIKGLSARPDGLYATAVEWLPEGEAALAARSHRYVSPTFHHTDTGAATWLHSVALVAAPALSMPAVADANGHIQEPFVLKAIARALGLAETADEAACLSAIATMTIGKVDKAVHDQALANLAAVTTERDSAASKLAELAATSRKSKVDTMIEGALAAKKIVPAQRDQYVALCATDAGLAQVEALLAVTPANLQASTLDGRVPSDADAPADPVALAAAASAYQKRLAEAGTNIAYADAVIAVKEGKK